MNKRFSAVIAAVVAVILGVCFAVSSFGFVKDGYGENQIQALSDLGLIEYREAEATITRGEALVTVMVMTGYDVYVEDYDPEVYPCSFTDVSADLMPYVAVAKFKLVLDDMPYDLFRENDNITLEEMLCMTIRAYGYYTDAEGCFWTAEYAKLYKTCEADAFVFDLTYASYAEILWNLLVAPSLYEEGKTMADLLIERGVIDATVYEATKDMMADYVFGQKHEYVTKALSWFAATDDSESEPDTTTPEDTTTAAPDTTKPETTYDIEDNDGYSPPFKP